MTYFKSRYVNLLLLFFLGSHLTGRAQVGQADKDTSRDTVQAQINILNSGYGEYIQSDQSSVHKLMHNVKLLHKGDTLYCDSAFFYTGQNSVEAFGEVAIYQADGTTAYADYMRYTGGNRKVYMSHKTGEVVLTDPDGSSLWSKEIDYNLNTKTGNYYNGGTLESESTILSSRTGTYNLRTKEARFREEVEVFDPEYHVISTDLGYNTESKIVRFFGPSVVTNENSILQTRNGVYNTVNKTSRFVDRASILNEAQYIEGDTLDYDQATGTGIAIGNVIAIDTNQKTTLYANKARYNEISGDLLAFGNPIMKTLDQGDSLLIKADTFFSAYLPYEQDTLSSQDSLNLTADFFKTLAAADNATKGSTQDSAGTQQIDTLSRRPPGLSDSIRRSMDSTSSVLKSRMDNLVYAREIMEQAGDRDSMVPAENTRSTDVSVNNNTVHSSETRETQDTLSAKMRQDTLPAAATAVPADSIAVKAMSSDTGANSADTDNQGRRVAPAARALHQPGQPDSTRKRYFTAYHNVRIFSDSLQGKCDSLRYSQQDSLLRMYIDPVLWSRKSQITGEVILLLLDSNKLKELIVPEKAILISRSGPEKANMFDQIQGETIRAFLTNNNIDSLIAEPQASSIYYAKDDSDAYAGCTEAEAEKIEITFGGEEIKKIYYRVNVTQTMTPMTEVMPAQKRLSRFSWREEERPKDLKEFLDGRSLPEPAQLLSNRDEGDGKSATKEEKNLIEDKAKNSTGDEERSTGKTVDTAEDQVNTE